MRKRKEILKMIGMCAIAFAAGAFLELIKPVQSDVGNQKFEIYHSFCFLSEDYNDTSIKVIVNEEDYDIDAMFEDVKIFHNKLNGEPNELEIALYNSKGDLELGNCVESRNYYKD